MFGIRKIGRKKWSTENGWFFFSCDGRYYVWMICIGRFEISWAARR